MRHETSRPASRTSRDRDVLPDAPRPGPYETPYDVRRDYGGPPAERQPSEPIMPWLIPDSRAG